MTTTRAPRPIDPSRVRPSQAPSKHARIGVGAVLAIVALVAVLVVAPEAQTVQAAGTFASLRTPGQPGFVASHRGGKDAAPENTLPAFALALGSKAEYIETDLQLTSDGVPVLMHDWTLDRTTNGSGPVWALSYEQLSRLDAGSWYSAQFRGTRVPTLDEFLTLVAPSTKQLILELKGSWSVSQLDAVAERVAEAGIQHRVVFASFDLMTLRNLRTAAPDTTRVIITREVVGDPEILAAACGAVAIVTSRSFVLREPGIVERIHEAGLGVLVYTLNDEDTWAEAIALGVDGIITDSPQKLDDWLAATAGRQAVAALASPLQ